MANYNMASAVATVLTEQHRIVDLSNDALFAIHEWLSTTARHSSLYRTDAEYRAMNEQCIDEARAEIAKRKKEGKL